MQQAIFTAKHRYNGIWKSIEIIFDLRVFVPTVFKVKTSCCIRLHSVHTIIVVMPIPFKMCYQKWRVAWYWIQWHACSYIVLIWHTWSILGQQKKQALESPGSNLLGPLLDTHVRTENAKRILCRTMRYIALCIVIDRNHSHLVENKRSPFGHHTGSCDGILKLVFRRTSTCCPAYEYKRCTNVVLNIIMLHL